MAKSSDGLSLSFSANNYIAAGALGDLTGGAKFTPFKDIDFNAPSPIDYGLVYSGKLDLSGSLNSTAWTFITAPEDVSWDIANQANRVDMFGTNNPPVVAGSRGMRDLTLGNALVEGFVRRKQVEDKIAQLEALMNYRLNASDGFVSVPVYQIWANKNPYGGKKGYFIIKDIRIKETMRDTAGKTTRAYVDVSLMQVPAYQVNTGRDQASKVTAGVKSALISQVDLLNKESPTAAATGQADQVKDKKAGPDGPQKPPQQPPAQTSGDGNLDTQTLFKTRELLGRPKP
jgi:hypothetical protein